MERIKQQNQLNSLSNGQSKWNIYLCSYFNGVCLTPHTFYDEPHDDIYSCLLSGYEKSINKTKEIGRVEINKHGIYSRFSCDEKEFNKEKTDTKELGVES